ncbi:MAG: hypothetical protein KAY37_02415 [Phycisphaerae bacterium]|nr:hypothetical protein [Phycisphaerae bacterium]
MMNSESDKLEHLFSRTIDGENSSDDRELMEALFREDPELPALFEEYRGFDRMVGDALRWDMNRAGHARPIHTLWGRFGRGLLAAAAACLATLAWLHPNQPMSQNPREPGPAQASSSSWFAPSAPRGDVVRPIPTAYERPELRLRGTQREWIVIPGDQPGTYLIIEVDHVRTHVIGVHQDF